MLTSSEERQLKDGITVGQSKRQDGGTDPDDIERIQNALREDLYAFSDLPQGSSAYTAGERFAFLVLPSIDGDRVAAADFWEAEIGIGNPPDAFVDGYARGISGQDCE